MSRLPAGASIFTAELYAIYTAVIFISKLPGKYIIFSDSLSSIKSLKCVHRPCNYLISQIANAIVNLPPDKITLEWIPSHVGIPGNEQADQLAAQSLQLKQITRLPLPTTDTGRIIKKHYRDAWQVAWSSHNQSTTAFKPLLGTTTGEDLPRPLQVCITRLRLKTCLVTHKHYFTQTSPATCNNCNCIMSLHHLLLSCPVFSKSRQSIVQLCNEISKPIQLSTILAPDFPIMEIIKYLREISYLSKI